MEQEERYWTAFFDELGKISEVNLKGLGPENMLQAAPEPMATPGFEKARQILGLADQMKTAAPVGNAYGIGIPQSKALMTPSQGAPSAEKNVKSFGANVIGGMGVGKLVTDFAHGPAKDISRKAGWYGMAAGGAAGLANYAVQRRRKAKQAEMEKRSFSPATALKASKQVGKLSTNIKAGPSLRKQVGSTLIGRKFAPPSL